MITTGVGKQREILTLFADTCRVVPSVVYILTCCVSETTVAELNNDASVMLVAKTCDTSVGR